MDNIFKTNSNSHENIAPCRKNCCVGKYMATIAEPKIVPYRTKTFARPVVAAADLHPVVVVAAESLPAEVAALVVVEAVV